jgi:hypothetical protein
MQVRQAGTSTNAIRIDKAFFLGLERIIIEHRQAALGIVAESHDLTVTGMNDLIAKYEQSATNLFNQDRSLFDIAIRLNEKRKLACSEQFLLSYDDGYTFQSTSLDQITGILETQSGSAERFQVKLGSIGDMSFELDCRNKYYLRSSYTISGPKPQVEHIFAECVNLLKSSVPEHGFLYKDSFWSVAVLTAGLSAGVAFAFFMRKHLSFNILFLSSAVGWATGIFAALLFLRLRKAFRLVQFDFGQQARLRNAYLKTVAGILSLVVVPWAINLLS